MVISRPSLARIARIGLAIVQLRLNRKMAATNCDHTRPAGHRDLASYWYLHAHSSSLQLPWADALGEHPRAQGSDHSVKRQARPQLAQRGKSFCLGEDPSHDGHNSYQAKQQ
jgi:hypothetical protein